MTTLHLDTQLQSFAGPLTDSAGAPLTVRKVVVGALLDAPSKTGEARIHAYSMAERFNRAPAEFTGSSRELDQLTTIVCETVTSSMVVGAFFNLMAPLVRAAQKEEEEAQRAESENAEPARSATASMPTSSDIGG